MKAKHLLEIIGACSQAIEWAGEMTIEEAWNTCERGDWMLWFYSKQYPENIRELTLAKGHCANTVRHLMKDERSINAVDAAISFGEGKISEDKLKCAAYAAYAVAYCSYAAAAAADVDAYASYAASYAAYAAAAADAIKENRKQTSDICRKYLKL